MKTGLARFSFERASRFSDTPRRADKDPRRRRMIQAIAVSNQKGGVAKTTTALSLAAELARRGRRVLAIDLDPQANLTMGLGIDPDRVRGRSTFDLLTDGNVEVDAVAQVAPVRKSETSGSEARWMASLRIVPAEVKLAQAERELYGEIGFDELLAHKLSKARESFDVAVIDCPPSLGVLTVNALAAARLTLVPVQCEYFSAKGLVRLIEVVDVIRERRNPGLRVRVVPTLYDPRNNICRAVLAELKRQFPRELTRAVIGIDTRLREAAAKGLPIALYAPRSRASVAYRALAEEVADDAAAA
jgi:chromosome partitioning protein